jgi:hypothetical protein
MLTKRLAEPPLTSVIATAQTTEQIPAVSAQRCRIYLSTEVDPSTQISEEDPQFADLPSRMAAGQNPHRCSLSTGLDGR